MDESGSTQNPEKDQPSASRSRSEEQAAKRRHILIVEDNAGDVFLISRAIKIASLDVDVDVVMDGEHATRFFDAADAGTCPCPGLVILDINLPRKQGTEVLQYMRMSRTCGKALVIAMSTSGSDRDRESMMNLGVNGYFHKPSEYGEFMKLGNVIKDLLSEPHPGEADRQRISESDKPEV